MYFITIPDFELHVHMAIRPILKDIPFAISDGSRLIACNTIARNAGINKGMKNGEARRKSTFVTIEKSKPILYENFSKEFYRILSLYTNTIEPINYHSAFIELPAAFDVDHRSEIIRSISKKISSELEIETAIGEATTKTTAEIAARIISPKGILTIPKELSSSFLQTIPLSFLPGIGRRSAAILWGLGIKTMGDLAQQSNEMMFQLFGKTGLLLKDRARGIDNRTVEPPLMKKSISKSLCLGHPSTRWHYLVSMLHFCLSKIERELHASCQWASSMRVSLTLLDGKQIHTIFTIPKFKRSRVGFQAESALRELIENNDKPVQTIQIRTNQLFPENNSEYFFKSVKTKTPKVSTGQLPFTDFFVPLRKAVAV